MFVQIWTEEIVLRFIALKIPLFNGIVPQNRVILLYRKQQQKKILN